MGCEEQDSTTVSVSVSPITRTTLPSSARVNESVSFSTEYLLFNGGGEFHKNQTTMRGDTITITYLGIYRIEGDERVTTDVRKLNRDYTFNPDRKGVYLFRFNQGSMNPQKTYLLDTLVVH